MSSSDAKPPTDPIRLQKTLGRPGCARLRQRLRQRLERGIPLAGRLTFQQPSEEERADIEALLGRPPGRGTSFGLDLEVLEAAIIQAGLAPSLEIAITTLTGPVENRKDAEALQEARWNQLIADFAPPRGNLPSDWLAQLRATGRLKRLGSPEDAAFRLQQLTRLRKALPASGEPLAQLAARLFGDSHALDPGQPLANLALRLIHHLFSPEEDPEASRADRRRDTWAAAGVLCDALSAPPVVLNLPSAADHFLGEILRRAAEAGEPVHLTLRQLLKYPLFPDETLKGARVFVCENPTIAALAADALGANSHPLVCINGEPATPARTLLRQLREAGADIYYHGDFDWRGVQIASRVFHYCGARPWRFDASAYLAAPKQKKLTGSPVDTPWDPELSLAMRTHAKSVHEEAIASTLITDLKR
ncbi:MAG: TIGR02679 family protein [Opitutales bacterium]|nr:TIGR02679 family protein [Opitutales bacterium]MCH8541514.1 TIGR02679 family protein [Opitutales bacterium]